MKVTTARKIKSCPFGKIAKNVATATGKSMEQVVNEASRVLAKFRKRERRRRRLGAG